MFTNVYPRTHIRKTYLGAHAMMDGHYISSMTMLDLVRIAYVAGVRPSDLLGRLDPQRASSEPED